MGTEVTLLTIYDKVASIGGKLDAHIGVVTERLDHGGKQLADHEERLRSLESWRWKVAGAAALIGVLSGGSSATFIIWLLSGHH